MYKFNKYVSSVICLMRYFRFRKKSVDLHIFSSPEHKMLRVSYCDRPLSVMLRPSCVVRQLFYLNIFSS